MIFLSFLAFCIIISVIFGNGRCTAYMVEGDSNRHREVLDPNGSYILEWAVDPSREKIMFEVTVETLGWVGFGLSNAGKMSGADIVVGGMDHNGEAYFSDRHAVASQLPEEDPSQDWTLHQARENRTHTVLGFSRDFQTCDPQDYPITEDKVSIIWSYGQSDNISYHYRNRGVFPVYLLNPDHSPEIVADPIFGDPTVINPSTGEALQVWTVHSRIELPTEDTTYWCTMQQAPALIGKHHVVGMDVRFDDEVSRNHVYHLLVYKCNLPQGSDISYYDSYDSHIGQQCLNVRQRQPAGPIPTEYCTEIFMVWARGGRAFFTPPHIGIPFGGESSNEYYLLQVHYDNPDHVSGNLVDMKLDIFYTSQLRPNDGGILNIRHITPGRSPSFLVPPSSISHTILGICGSRCTREILPKRGIHIYGVLLHSHNSGKRLKLQQFRQARELPWIAKDENFRSDHQQVRLLPAERTVLPWDVLMINCEYDNTWTNGTVVGGYSSRQEMCAAFILYYNKLQNGYQECSSEIGSPVHRRRLLNGVSNIAWSPAQMEFLVDNTDMQYTRPLVGMSISQVSDYHVNWTEVTRNDLQKFQLTHQQVNWCFPEVYAGGPVNTPETELIPPRPKRQKQPSRSVGRRRKRTPQLTPPTVIPRYEPEWEDPRRYSHYPKVKPYEPPKYKCSGNVKKTKMKDSYIKI